MMPHRMNASRSGFAVVTVLLLTVVLGALLVAMFALTNTEITSSRVNADITSGFYAAEAGLNVRGELIRDEFLGYNRPSGTSPGATDPCVGGNLGSGEMACQTFEFNDRTVSTYVLEDPANNDLDDSERTITVPPGELFAGLSAIQYRYSVFSEATPPGDDRPEALLEMIFRVRLVPLFQFAVFYDKDLGIGPGPSMTLDGRVHANGDLYLNAGATLQINGQVTAAVRSAGTGGNVHRGGKGSGICTGIVRVQIPGENRELVCSGSSFNPVPAETIDSFKGQIRTRLDTLTVPPPVEFGVTGLYWSEADVRIALDLRSGVANASPVVLRSELSGGLPEVDTDLTSTLEACLAEDPAPRGYGVRSHAGLTGSPTPPDPASLSLYGGDVRAVEWSNSFRDRRENRSSDTQRTSYRLMLEVDVRGVLNCLQASASNPDPKNFFAGRTAGQDDIGTDRNGGLVAYFTVLGPESASASSGYGVRLRNAEVLGSSLSGAPEINGLTVVSDQAVFTSGNYNGATGRPFPSDSGAPNPADPLWRPAAILADTIHVLSGRRGPQANNTVYHDDPSAYPAGSMYTTDSITSNRRVLSNRRATPTTIAAALLANTGTEVGLGDYPRMHERWTGEPLRYTGSFVSLGEPNHSTGPWPDTGGGDTGVYDPPVRAASYDTRFNDVANLPPLTPRFVYLVLERFIREFDR
jgi:hypothetical protein